MGVGSRLPDAYLPDACGEGVRLHQLTGGYLVIGHVALGEAASEALDGSKWDI